MDSDELERINSLFDRDVDLREVTFYSYRLRYGLCPPYC